VGENRGKKGEASIGRHPAPVIREVSTRDSPIRRVGGGGERGRRGRGGEGVGGCGRLTRPILPSASKGSDEYSSAKQRGGGVGGIGFKGTSLLLVGYPPIPREYG